MTGQIFIEGIHIAEVSLQSLRGQIGVVPQHVLLVNGSVRDNVGYDPRNEEIRCRFRVTFPYASVTTSTISF
jgi:ATP-binding cassette, subfamily B, bacterial